MGTTMALAILWIVTATLVWLFLGLRLNWDRRMAILLKRACRSNRSRIETLTKSDRGAGRVIGLAGILAVSVTATTAIFANSTVWWQRPFAHVPLALIYLFGVFFAAGFFLLRTLVLNQVVLDCFHKSPPPDRVKNQALYDGIARQHLISACFALFAILYVYAWTALVVLQNTESRELSLVWGLVSLTLAVPFVWWLVVRPIWSQHETLSGWRQSRLERLNKRRAELLREIIEKGEDAGAADMQFAYDFAHSSFPVWSLPSERLITFLVVSGGTLILCAVGIFTLAVALVDKK